MNQNSFTLILRITTVCAAVICLSAVAQEDPKPFPQDGEIREDAHNRLPKLVTRVAAESPATPGIRHLEDEIHVAFVVDTTGCPTRVRAFFSHHPELENAAEEAVKQWRFTAGIHHGRPVLTQMIAKVRVAPPPPPAP